ncbi:MAG: IS110 family transposase [Methylobacter sp.]|nr:IS110 family transposase [Methylobacter sp.]MDP2428357.1 IS110 family transposase [Methylobacter sp.]MDP3054157.1 IS110 family transposase [Methylobacter sp.]MDP3363962.1 IS110 family transposase [Methylobacter sp.]MDZ4218422.1 IS110 family transposase [Methylobacter sp.]
MNNSVIGLDIAKHIFHLFTLGVDGKMLKKKLKRNELLTYFANYPASIIGMEACGSAHHWARELTKLGHEVILLNARYVKNFVVGNKNDFNDAAAIYDAVTRPNKRVVAIKTVAQQDIQLVHSIRKELVDKRTALVNQTRGLLSERGIIINKGIAQVRQQLPLILEDAENGLTDLSRELFAEQYEKIKALDKEIKDQDLRINRLCNANELSKRFLDVPGVGPLTATIVAADMGDTGKGYESSRDYAASLGVVPRQHSSGDKQVYLGISKRGNRYIRTLLIHGARSVLKNCAKKTDKLSLWLQALVARRGFNKAAVALANKNARILWAMANKNKDYEALAA